MEWRYFLRFAETAGTFVLFADTRIGHILPKRAFGPEEEQALNTPGDLELTYLHRSAGPGEEPELLAAAVAALELPAGRGDVFVHGEAGSVRNLRRHLIADRGLDPATMSISGYWKLKRTEEGWRDDKAEWARLVEADLAAAR